MIELVFNARSLRYTRTVPNHIAVDTYREYFGALIVMIGYPEYDLRIPPNGSVEFRAA